MGLFKTIFNGKKTELNLKLKHLNQKINLFRKDRSHFRLWSILLLLTNY